jgi:hypothetical protein
MIIEGTEYLTAAEAIEIIRANNGRPDLSQDYIRDLVRYGKISRLALSSSFNVYRADQVRQVLVDRRGGKHRQDKQHPSAATMSRKAARQAQQKNQG